MDDRRRRFELVVLPHLDAAYRFARWLSRSPGDADDVVQEAVLRAFRGFDALRGSDVKAWLLTIVKNCHLTALKQQRRRAFVPLPEEHDVQDGEAMIATTPDPEISSVRRDEERTLDRLMSAVPEEHRDGIGAPENAKSSPKLPARMSREIFPRNMRSAIGEKVEPIFQVVT